METEKKFDRKKAGVRHGIFTGIVIAFIVVIFTLYSMNIDENVRVMEQKWVDIDQWEVGDNPDLTGIQGGVLMVYVVDHDVGWDYTSNITVNNSVWANSDANNTEISRTIPHTDDFDVVAKVRVNVTQAYASGNSSWVSSWVRAYIDSTSLSLTDQRMDKYVIPNNGTNFMHLHFVWDGTWGAGGAGDQITEGQNVSVNVTMQCYTY